MLQVDIREDEELSANKINKILFLYEIGDDAKDIGEDFELSEQEVNDIIERYYYENG